MKTLKACREAPKSAQIDIKVAGPTNTTTGSADSKDSTLLHGFDIAFLLATGLIAVIVVLQVAAVVTL